MKRLVASYLARCRTKTAPSSSSTASRWWGCGPMRHGNRSHFLVDRHQPNAMTLWDNRHWAASHLLDHHHALIQQHFVAPTLLRTSPWSSLWHHSNHYGSRVKTTDAAVEIALEVPGFKLEDINVTLEQGKSNHGPVLSIRGNQKQQQDSGATTETTTTKDTSTEKENDHGSSLSSSRSFAQTFVLDDALYLNIDDITAKLEDGILTITVPKDVEGQIKATRTIPITASATHEANHDDGATPTTAKDDAENDGTTVVVEKL